MLVGGFSWRNGGPKLFCAHTTAHSSALKLLAFLCLLFLSRVIFPFVWYIASVRLYFEIFVSATLAYFYFEFTFLIVIIEKKAKEFKFADMMKSTTNGPKFSSPDQFTQSVLHKVCFSTNCTTTWNLRLCPDMNWSPKIYKIVRGERMEEKFQTSSSVLHNKVCLHWISTRLNTWNFISNIVKRFVTWC